MANYTGIQGQNILIVDTDPANPTEGQIWYNSTSNLLKGYQFAVVNAWSSGGNLNNARRVLSGTGTQTAALAIGGFDTNATEKYDGISWTTTGSISSPRYYMGAAGTQTAGLVFGGSSPTTATEEFNGTSWSPGGSLNTGRQGLGGCGTQTAALGFGGYSPPNTTATELYNGTVGHLIQLDLILLEEILQEQGLTQRL
jgi:hypothetical protein